VKLLRPVSRTWTPNPITSSSMRIGDVRPPVVADFTNRSVNLARFWFACMALHPNGTTSSQGGSRADSKMLRIEFCPEA
jgi:hypothetical protein